jgi:pimeloyl-ACP methyl ester carboxylesterase
VVSAVLGGGGGILEGEAPELIREWRTRLERAARDGTPVYEAMRMPDWPAFPPEIVAMVNQNDAAALAASMRGDDGLRVTVSELRGLKLPVAMVVGADDSLALSDVDLMRSAVSGLRVHLLPGLDHLTAVNHPLFLQALMESLRDGTSRSPGTELQQQQQQR